MPQNEKPKKEKPVITVKICGSSHSEIECKGNMGKVKVVKVKRRKA